MEIKDKKLANRSVKNLKNLISQIKKTKPNNVLTLFQLITKNS